eukprot:NP_491121.1 Uncharacterized protein CELE_Y54E10A.13 [Caenorhabditis elegans]
MTKRRTKAAKASRQNGATRWIKVREAEQLARRQAPPPSPQQGPPIHRVSTRGSWYSADHAMSSSDPVSSYKIFICLCGSAGTSTVSATRSSHCSVSLPRPSSPSIRSNSSVPTASGGARNGSPSTRSSTSSSIQGSPIAPTTSASQPTRPSDSTADVSDGKNSEK